MKATHYIYYRFCIVAVAVMVFCILSGNYEISAQQQRNKNSVETTINSHKKQVESIEKEIEYLDNLIARTQKEHKNTLEELVFMQKKVANRKNLLKQLDNQVEQQNKQIDAHSQSINKLERQLDTLEHYYKHLIVNAYKNRDPKVWFTYILSSKDLEQGYRRFKYLKNYSNAINKQGEEIKRKREEIIEKKSNLLTLRSQTLKTIQTREAEYKTMLAESNKTQNYAKKLNANRNRYKKQMEQKRKEANLLNKEIQRMLAQAVKAKPASTQTKEQQENKIQLSASFQNNKGKLPWPVKGGVVTETFGQHYHPLFKGVKMPFNNGINISTELNSKVYAVFDGVVKQIIAIPGYNQCVLVQHGNYFTFYCKLASVSVKVDQNISTGQELGTLSNSQNTSTLHFELWHNTTKQNPELWLRKR